MVISAPRGEPRKSAVGRRLAAAPAAAADGAALLDVARLTDNELILFDRERRESWIIYPPRSKYDFLRRPSAKTVLVEHRPWAPFSQIDEHHIEARDGCLEHGLACAAQAAIQAGLDVGWNPFA